MGTASQPGAGFYPFLIALGLVSLSLTILIQSLREEETQPEAFPGGKDLQRVIGVGLIIFFFILLLKTLGYVLSSGALMGATLRLFGLRSWGKVILISTLTAVVSYYIFTALLSVPLPRGLFFS